MSNNFNPIDIFESPLKFGTSAIQCFPDGKGYLIGSIEGRCCVRFYDTRLKKTEDTKQFCYKCHQKPANPTNSQSKDQIVSSVNGFCFNEKHGTYYSYGSDGVYVSWNKDTRAKYRTSSTFPSAIVAADQTQDSTMFAYAIGYDWARGAEGLKEQQYQNRLFIRCPDTAEIYKPK